MTRRRLLALIALPILLLACAGGHDTGLAQALLVRGLQAQQRGQTSDATRDYLGVIKADPNNKLGYYDLAVIQQAAGQDAAAAANYQKALTLDPRFVAALFNLAIIDTPSAPQTALDLYHRAIAVQPKYAEAHLNLGFVLLGLGQQTDANAELRTAIALSPSLTSRVPAAILRTVAATTTTSTLTPTTGVPKVTNSTTNAP